MKQSNMFAATSADLPIFSGTPVTARVSEFKPVVELKQFEIWCPMCRGTKVIILGKRKITCPCQFEGNQKVEQDARLMSPERIMFLTGYEMFDDIQRIRNEFVEFIIKSSTTFPNLDTAWEVFWTIPFSEPQEYKEESWQEIMS